MTEEGYNSIYSATYTAAAVHAHAVCCVEVIDARQYHPLFFCSLRESANSKYVWD